MTRRPILVFLLGAALREALPLLRKFADWCDPAGSATQAWGPRVEVPDYVPDALTSDR